MKKQSPFRKFVNDLWFEHKDEILYFEKRLPNYDSNKWFNRIKWWLRTEYKKSKLLEKQ